MATYKSKNGGIRYHAVFVYGTLKQGHTYHHALERSPGEPATAEGFNLYRGPGYPIAVPGDGVIEGELYIVPDAVLRRIDMLENHPHMFSRMLCPAKKANGETQDAWLYYQKEAGDAEPIPSGIWHAEDELSGTETDTGSEPGDASSEVSGGESVS